MKRINALKAMSLLLLGLMSSASQAVEYVKFAFTAHGTDVQSSGGTPAGSPASLLNLGTAINGYFYYELGTPYTSSDPNGTGGTVSWYSNPNTIGIKFTSSTGFSFAPNSSAYFDPFITVDDSSSSAPDPRDKIWVGAAEHTASGADQDVELFLADKHNAGTFGSSVLPTSLSGSDYDGALTLFWSDNNGHTFRFVATVDTLTQVAAVPEPETYAMLLGGLGLVGVAARRRQRQGQAAA